MSIIQSVIKANLENIKPYLPESRKNSDPFAFLIFAITSVLDVTINEAILCSTEGSGDGGIDAIYIDEAEYFWFLNNGVTIVCYEFFFTDVFFFLMIRRPPRSTLFNGGQTTK